MIWLIYILTAYKAAGGEFPIAPVLVWAILAELIAELLTCLLIGLRGMISAHAKGGA